MMKLATFAVLIAGVSGDIYMHNLAGSNNRNRERNDNRNNNNRIFDSQNNGKGGYPWRGDREVIGKHDPLNLYEGSMVKMEWTEQHACGANPNTHCSVVLQYGCEDTLPKIRDGLPTGPLQAVPNNAANNNFQQASFVRNNADGTNSISAATKDDIEYGMHENFDYYSTYCQQRQRNKGLYVADQKLNGNDATKTRQNPNGGQSGFECPEERDYYPYWHPSPWRDVAVLTSNTSFCPYYQAESQNVKSSWYCQMSDNNRKQAPDGLRPINGDTCAQFGGSWIEVPAFNTPAPTCALHSFSRDNHLGNSQVAKDGQPDAASYNLQVPYVSQMYTRAKMPLDAPGRETVVKMTDPAVAPDLDSNGGLLCVVRLRYNISTNDYPSMKGMDGSGSFFDAKYSCPRVQSTAGQGGDIDAANTGAASDVAAGCSSLLDDGNRPRYNRPYVQMFEDKATPKLSIAMNTNQLGRTFQDRSYVFKIQPRPANVPNSATIWNLNNRGKRGNIVQAYPAVEYDFAPNVLVASKNDYLHIQFHGSDYNTNRNPNNAEGWRFSDRFNMVQVQERNTQIPLKASESSLFLSQEEALKYALLGQEKLLNATGGALCEEFFAGKNGEDDAPTNCGKMNAAPAHMDFGLKPLTEINRGEYQYISTRNNNFSNRSQKGSLFVTGFSTAEAVGIAAGTIAGIGMLAAGGLVLVKRGTVRLPGARV